MKLPKNYHNAPDKAIVYGHFASVDLSPDIPFEPSEVNGAYLKDEAYNNGVRFNKPILTEDGYVISDLTMIVPRSLKMSDIFDRMPYGIINKTITGLGATTLEIMSSTRNSIVVVPTKTLAYSKVKQANEKKGNNYAMYIGSPMEDIRLNIKLHHVNEYIQNKTEDDVQKYVVVADSLPMLINYLTQLNIDVYSEYFLMVDEIDTLQADSSYRPRLEIVMDYYFKFNFTNRAVVSATLMPFSNSLFEKESILEIRWDIQPQRKIKLVYANYVEDATIDEINYHLQTNDDKVIIAYNSLDGIFNIIDQLDVKKEECGILCSDRSSDKVKDYKDSSDKAIDEKGHLRHRVTFITCAYFAGIDIQDKCHLITVSSRTTPYTYLSISKLTQIAGRGRNGNLSETIIYDIAKKIETSKHKDALEYQKSLIQRAQRYSEFMNATLKVVREDKDLEPMRDFMLSFMDYISKSRPTKYDYPINIIRIDSNNSYAPAYFNIDSLIEKWNLRHTLYARKDELFEALIANGLDIIEDITYLQKKEEHIQPNKEKREDKSRMRKDRMIETLRSELIEWHNNRGNEFAFNEIANKVDKKMKDTIVMAFKKLHLFYPVDELLDKLIEASSNAKVFKNIYNAFVFLALPNDNTFKAKVISKFGCNPKTGVSKSYITPVQRLNLIEECFIETFLTKPKATKDSMQEFATSFLSFKTSNGNYRPTGFNPKGLPDPTELMPTNYLKANTFILPHKKDS